MQMNDEQVRISFLMAETMTRTRIPQPVMSPVVRGFASRERDEPVDKLARDRAIDRNDEDKGEILAKEEQRGQG